MAQFNQFSPVDDFQRGRRNALSIQAQEQGIARENQAAPIRNQLQKLGLQQQQRGFKRTGVQNEQTDAVQKATILHNLLKSLETMPDEKQRAAAFSQIEPKLRTFGIETENIKSRGFGDEQIQLALAGTKGFLNDPSKLAQLSSGQRERGDLKRDLEGAFLPNGQLKPVKDMTAIQKSAAIGLKLIPAAGTATSQERLGDDEDLTKRVATSQATIRAAIKEEEVKAKARGEALTSLNRAKAALPGLKEVTTKLKQLADVATFTTTGKAVNILAKELFGISTEGGTARTTMRSVVDNQVLPLLRDTFGAAFTEGEGERLRNTLLDPDTTPDEMKATLDSFIDQKIRNIETGEREIGGESDLPEGVTEDDITTTMQIHNLTREEVLARLRGQ